MKHLNALIRKDLTRRLRAPANLILTLMLPLVLVAVIGITFKPGSSVELPPVKMLIENHDDKIVGKFLGSALQNEELARYFDMTLVERGAGEDLTASGKASAALIIPAGFSDSVFAGKPVSLTLLKNPGEFILPEIAEGFTDMLALVLSGASRALSGTLRQMRDLMDDGNDPTDAQVARMAIAVHHVLKSSGTLLLPPAIEVKKRSPEPEIGEENEEEEEGGSPINLFAFLFPGMVALGLLFVGQNAMHDLIQEKEQGQINRLLSSPTSMGTVVVSKLFSTLLLLILCNVLLTLVGLVLFDIRLGNVIASFLLVIAQGLAITGLMALIFAVSRTERQAGTLSTIVIFGMSILGGSMIPTDSLPGMAQKASPFTLNYWAIEGFQKVILLGEGIGDILPHLAILSLFGLVTAAFGSLLFPRSLRR